MSPHKCPVCDGLGTVPKHFYNPHKKQKGRKREGCRTCCGSGVLWDGDQTYVPTYPIYPPSIPWIEPWWQRNPVAHVSGTTAEPTITVGPNSDTTTWPETNQ